MPKSRPDSQKGNLLDDIYHSNNLLRLKDPSKIHDTTLLKGACYTSAGTSARQHGAKNYFSGYVFRGDIRPPDIVFQAGFEIAPSTQSADKKLQALTWAYTGSGKPMGAGVSTTICVQAAGYFCHHGIYMETAGYVYLIDATLFKGFAIASTPASHLAGWFPYLHERICDVNFMHPIPNTNIVGVVWPDKRSRPENVCWRSAPATGLLLAVNPEYEKGMAGAKEVENLFSGWD